MLRLLLVPLLLLAVAGAGWLLLREAPVEIEDEDPIGAAGGDRPAEPAPVPAVASRRPELVELAVDGPRPRIAVLAADQALPPPGAGPVDPMLPLHEAAVRGDLARLSGEDLLQQVAALTYLRFRREADLEDLQRLDPDLDWPGDHPLPLAEVVEHWRRQGFEAEPFGDMLVITRRDE